MTEFTITKKNAELFQKILRPIMIDPTIESWQLAIALDWARDKGIRFLWFHENGYGIVHNGLSLVDRAGNVLWNEIAGYDTDEERLLQEAVNAHTVMHMDDTRIEWENTDD